MDTPEMDCITFIKTVQTLSDIPILLVSRRMDIQLINRAVGKGVVQFFYKSITREDARGLWQYMHSKGRKITSKEVNSEEKDCLHQSDSVQPMDNSQNDHMQSDPEATKSKNQLNAKSDDNVIKRNPDIQVILPTGQQAIGMIDVASLTQPTSHLQNLNTGTPGRTNVSSDGQTLMQLTSYQDIGGPSTRTYPDATCERTNFQTLGTTPLPQSNKAAHSTTPGQSHLVLNMSPTTNNENTFSGPGKEHALFSPSLNSRSHLPVNSALNLGQSVSQFGVIEGSTSMNKASLLSNTNTESAVNRLADNLQGRIDQIRRAYRTDNTISRNSTFSPNTQAGTSEHLLLGAKRVWAQLEHVSSEDVSNIAELVSKRGTTFECNAIPNYGYNHGSDSSNLGFAPSQNGYLPPQAPCATQIPLTSSENYVQTMMQNSSNIQANTMTRFQTSSNLPPQAPYASQAPFTSSANHVQSIIQNSSNLQEDPMARFQTSSNFPPQAPCAIQVPLISSANRVQSMMQNSSNIQGDTMARFQASSNIPPQAPYATQVSLNSSANYGRTIMQNSSNLQGDTMARFQTSNNFQLQAPLATQVPFAASANYGQSIMQNSSNLQGDTMTRFQTPSNLPPQAPYATQAPFTSTANHVQSIMQNSSNVQQGDAMARFQTFSNLPSQAPYAAQVPYTSSANYGELVMQNSSNLQGDTMARLRTSECPSYSFNNSLVRAEGFTNQCAIPTNDLGIQNLEGIMVLDSSADILKNAGTSNSQQLNEGDKFFDEILAELHNDFPTNDLKSSGYNTGNGV